MNQIRRRLMHYKESSDSQQKGQSIVLIALMMVAIIAFVGIAIDVGFIFARGSQLQSAIDSAALAGVVELSGWSQGGANNATFEASARTRSAQFLNANNMPVSVTASINITNNIDVSTTPLGAVQYAVTATWPVETYFLKVLGFREPINLTRSATAAIFSLADIYASRRVEDGVLSTSNQAVFGPDSCSHMGDPFSPFVTTWNRDLNGPYTYTYRIYIPPDYGHDVVRVELFDPDSINTSLNTVTIDRSETAQNWQNAQDEKTCGTDGGNSQQYQPCLVRTDELDLVTGSPNLELDQINPYWFVRIDETRRPSNSGPGESCGENGYRLENNTQTRYTLSYFAQTPGSSPVKVPLVTYFGQTGDDSDNIYGGTPGEHLTDLHWVSPGSDVPFSTVDDPGVTVPVTPLNINSFEVNLTTDVSNMVVDQNTGARYIYLDVQAMSGSSENGFEVWAGPPTYTTTVPSEVNARNLYILDNPGSHSSEGVTVYGLGNLPMNSNFDNVVDVPLMYVGPDMIDQTIRVSIFDSDSGAAPPLVFYFDSLAFTPSTTNPLGYDPDGTDWAMSFHVNGATDPEGGCTMIGNSCNNKWAHYTITIPGNTDSCDYDNQTMEDCTPFFGGRLIARYEAGFSDTYGIQIRLEGLPYLVK